jgi:hypothetical protein
MPPSRLVWVSAGARSNSKYRRRGLLSPVVDSVWVALARSLSLARIHNLPFHSLQNVNIVLGIILTPCQGVCPSSPLEKASSATV